MSIFAFSSAELASVRLSLLVASCAVFFSLPFGIFFAWLLSRKNFFGKTLLEVLVHAPLVLPPIVIGYILLVSFGKSGFLGSFFASYLGIQFSFRWTGAALASAVMAFPLLVRSIKVAMEGVDSGLEDAARMMGAGPLKVFFTVTLPLSSSGILSGIVLAFARSLGEFGATITFVSNIPGETQTLPLALYTLTQVPNGEAGAFRLCVLAILLSVVALLISSYLERRNRHSLL